MKKKNRSTIRQDKTRQDKTTKEVKSKKVAKTYSVVLSESMLKRVKEFFRRVMRRRAKHVLLPRELAGDNDVAAEPWLTLKHSVLVPDIVGAASHGVGAATANARQHAADLHDAKVQAQRLRSINVVKQKTAELCGTECRHSSRVMAIGTFRSDTPPPALPPPCWEFADLLVERVIGKGSYGTVMTIRNRRPVNAERSVHKSGNGAQRIFQDVTCALKVVRKKDIIETDQIEHIFAEKEILASLDHPLIVKLY